MLARDTFDPQLARRGIFCNVDLRPLVTYLWQLKAMRSEGPQPKIRWKASKYGQRCVAYVGRGRVTMSLTARRSVEETVEVLAHELVHMSCPRGEHHGELFKRRLIAVCREAFGLDLDTKALLDLPIGERVNQAYAIDGAIAKIMEAVDLSDRLFIVYPYNAPPPESEESRVERRRIACGERAERNEAHAREMLAQWERKLATAKKRAAKWRTKVRYYDRKAEAAAKGKP